MTILSRNRNASCSLWPFCDALVTSSISRVSRRYFEAQHSPDAAGTQQFLLNQSDHLRTIGQISPQHSAEHSRNTHMCEVPLPVQLQRCQLNQRAAIEVVKSLDVRIGVRRSLQL